MLLEWWCHYKTKNYQLIVFKTQLLVGFFLLKNYQKIINSVKNIKREAEKINAFVLFSKNVHVILSFLWTIIIIILNINNSIHRLLIVSALVITWILDIAESTKYLFPIAPKIAPKLIEILDSNSFGGIKNASQEIKKAMNDPPNNFIKL